MHNLTMRKTNESVISTLAALNARHLDALNKFGVTERAINLLAIISVDWVHETGVAAAEFRRDYRRDAELLRWMEDRRFIVSEGASPYAPQFNGFCAALVARKKIAVALFGEMKTIVNRALELLDQNPLRTAVRISEFVVPFSGSSLTVPALKLLGSASLGIHFNAGGDVQTVQFSEETLRGRKLLSYVSGYLDIILRPSVISSTELALAGKELTTFSINNLLLVEEVHKHASRALSQHHSAPDTAISSAKSTLESTLKYIAHTEGIEVSRAVKLPELFKLCKPFCGLGSDASHKMGRSIASMCTEIAEARNALGDSHGKSPDAPAPTRSEARFIVGVALHLSDCLLERYEAHRMMMPTRQKNK